MERETYLRSLLKALSYRLLAISSTAALVWYLSGAWRLALAVSSVEAVAKQVLFYLHERIWARIPTPRLARIFESKRS